MCREHSLIHMITALHQRLPCVEDSALSHSFKVIGRPPGAWSYLAEKRAKARGPDTPTRKAREGEESHDTPARKCARRWGVAWHPYSESTRKVWSHMTPLRGKAREVEESPDAPAREGKESPDALKGTSYQPSRFRWTITPVVYAPTSGVQLGRIA